jgi:hypothetical protein
VRLALDREGVPEAIVAPDAAGDVTGVDVYYALGEKRPQVRYWRAAGVTRQGRQWRSSLPVMDTWDDVRAFANVTYRSGVCLSTSLAHAIPAQFGKARATLAWKADLEDGANGLAHWKFLGAYTDPSLDWSHLKTGRDAEVGPYLTFDTAHLGDPVPVQLYTHLVGDPQHQGRDRLALSFRCRGEFAPEGLTCTVIEQDRSFRARTYSTKIAGKDLGPGWRDVVLPLSRFVDGQGRSPARWQVLDKFEIRGKAARRDPPRFARLRWIDPR